MGICSNFVFRELSWRKHIPKWLWHSCSSVVISVEWEVWYLKQTGLYYFSVSKKMYYFSVVCSRWRRRAAPGGVSLTAGISDFRNTHCNTDCNDSILWIIKLDGSECFFSLLEYCLYSCCLWDAFLSSVTLAQGNWKFCPDCHELLMLSKSLIPLAVTQ